MNKSIDTIMGEIKRDSQSLSFFASAIVGNVGDAAHQEKMMEATLMMLDILQNLHTDLKQAMEGGK